MVDVYEESFKILVPQVDNTNRLTPTGLLGFMQEAACNHSSLSGYGLNDVHSKHVSWIVLNWKIKILQRPLWSTKVTVRTWPRHSDKLYSYRDFEVLDEKGEKIAIATSKWLLMNIEDRSICKLTDEIRSSYHSVPICVFDTDIPRLKEPSSFDNIIPYQVMRRDLDVNEHVNNLYYLHFAYEALPLEVYQRINFSEISILYKKECKLGDEIALACTKVSEEEYMVTIKSKDLSVLHTIIDFHI